MKFLSILEQLVISDRGEPSIWHQIKEPLIHKSMLKYTVSKEKIHIIPYLLSRVL
jgi:hypothetical protein